MLLAALGDLGAKRQRNWATYIVRAGLDTTVPIDFDTAIEAIASFAEGVLLETLADGIWNPVERE